MRVTEKVEKSNVRELKKRVEKERLVLTNVQSRFHINTLFCLDN